MFSLLSQIDLVVQFSYFVLKYLDPFSEVALYFLEPLVDVAKDFFNLVQRALRTRVCLALHCISIAARSCFLVLGADSIICRVTLSAVRAFGTFWSNFTFSYNMLSSTSSTFEIVRAVFRLVVILEAFEALYYRGLWSRSLTSLSLIENFDSIINSISGIVSLLVNTLMSLVSLLVARLVILCTEVASMF